MSDIKNNLLEVHKNINEAIKAAKRDENEVSLICVSKTKPLSMVVEAYEAGERDFGENKVQEIVAKAPNISSDARFHMIGHLQKNKAKKAVQYSYMIHSVESFELAAEIDKHAKGFNKVMDILIEVNIGDEESKFGIKLCDVIDFVKSLSIFENICIRGLMCVAPYTLNSEENAIYFSNMKNKLNELKNIEQKNLNPDTLSMGMSGDYQVAIKEGATYIRIGTSIFGERNYNI